MKLYSYTWYNISIAGVPQVPRVRRSCWSKNKHCHKVYNTYHRPRQWRVPSVVADQRGPEAILTEVHILLGLQKDSQPSSAFCAAPDCPESQYSGRVISQMLSINQRIVGLVRWCGQTFGWSSLWRPPHQSIPVTKKLPHWPIYVKPWKSKYHRWPDRTITEHIESKPQGEQIQHSTFTESFIGNQNEAQLNGKFLRGEWNRSSIFTINFDDDYIKPSPYRDNDTGD